MRLGDLDALKENRTVIAIVNGEKMKVVPVKCINNAPTVEELSVIELKEPLPFVKAQKIVKALSKRPQAEWICDYRTCKCSVCNFTTVIDTYNFCPNCGAEMRGGVG